MNVLRTPESRFANLPDFSFEPHYLQIDDPGLGSLRMHFLDEGPDSGAPLVCLHGEPSWCYLYRKMIPHFSAAGFRVLAPDLIGFGRSDKPSRQEDYSYAGHVGWMRQWIESLDLRDVTLLGQDWGGLIGLRLVAEDPQRYARVSLANTGLPTGDHPMPEAFEKWQRYSQRVVDFDAGLICSDFGRGQLTDKEIEAYRAPFPSPEYTAGARRFPMLVPNRPDDPASADNRRAWRVLEQWHRPMLLCFSDRDPVTAGAEKLFLKRVPGARGQPHVTLHGGHFIQEEAGEAWARAVVGWAGDSVSA